MLHEHFLKLKKSTGKGVNIALIDSVEMEHDAVQVKRHVSLIDNKPEVNEIGYSTQIAGIIVGGAGWKNDYLGGTIILKSSAKLAFLVGVITILTGVLYVFRVYGPTESEVATWGFLAVVLGGIVVYLGNNDDVATHFAEKVLVFFLVLIQIPPILLWFSYNGTVISDGSLESGYVLGRWIFAFLHMTIVLLGMILFTYLFRRDVAK